MNILFEALKRNREYKQAHTALREQFTRPAPHPLLVTGLSESARFAFICCNIAQLREEGAKTPFLITVPDERDAQKLIPSFEEQGMTAVFYPYRDFNFYNITASHEFEHERLKVLSALLGGTADIVISTPDAALQYTMPRSVLKKRMMTLTAGGVCSIDSLVSMLVAAGYSQNDMVDGVGQFSRRGGILDIFPPDSEYPVRMEFFDDEIDSMGYFDIMTQRRIDNASSVLIVPSREVICDTEESDKNIRAELKKLISAQRKKCKTEESSAVLDGELEALDSAAELIFADKYISVIYPEKECLLDYFDNASAYFLFEYAAVRDRIQSYEWRTSEAISAMIEAGVINGRAAEYGKYFSDFEYFCENNTGVICDAFMTGSQQLKLSGLYNIITKQTTSYADKPDLLFEDLTSYLASKYEVVIACEGEKQARNLQGLLSERGIVSVICAASSKPSANTSVTIVYGENLPGFEMPSPGFACLSLYPNIFTRARAAGIRGAKKKQRKKSAAEKIMSYADLTEGDYVVHENHGIGMYMGLQPLIVDGMRRDFVKIQYSGTDVLYLPCDNLDAISKYIGARAEDGTLKLSKMGGAEWKKQKLRARGSAREMAKKLIALYAERLRKSGFAFPPDDEYQSIFEAGFEFEETEGQLTSVQEIKRDMEKVMPMDRLLCGDVGFGKTEVALRAAFKAVSASKQVAILVPTTILAMQHYQTVISRMRDFPVSVDVISRFSTKKKQDETLRRLKRGETDILIGTHRLISKDVQFKDLGLLIVDEEQRFGVAQKEKIKQLATDVDVLTLTATPIPRTLNMAMSGIRDMSVLEEAPQDRFPVQTYVTEYDDLIINDAINRELRRGGQVFYLYNRVEDIDRVAKHISEAFPDARIAVAHGQMERDQLATIWQALVAYEIDILISTTIIETGIDIPNANTLIIENADRMGLSQLHQIRGRIGRSGRRAYAYFTYPRGKVLSEDASKRLSAIRDYTEFGSGFKVALRDLEIRGAGNILGAEQHGHIENVGYDLYMKILNSAILEEKGESTPEKPVCTVEIKVNAYIPESYIKTGAQRIDAYKKIALIETADDLSDVTDELLDRYGTPPAAVTTLLKISLLRSSAASAGILRIVQNGQSVLIYPARVDALLWTQAAAHFPGKLLLNLSSKPYISFRCRASSDVTGELCSIIEYISEKAQNERKD